MLLVSTSRVHVLGHYSIVDWSDIAVHLSPDRIMKSHKQKNRHAFVSLNAFGATAGWVFKHASIGDERYQNAVISLASSSD